MHGYQLTFHPPAQAMHQPIPIARWLSDVASRRGIRTLASSPQQIVFLADSEQANQLLDLLASERIVLFYVIVAAQFGTLDLGGSDRPQVPPLPVESTQRLLRLEDEWAIRNLAARFTDAVNEQDVEAFRSLWSADATWEIGAPFAQAGHGVDAIASMFTSLLATKPEFVQLTHSGVVSFTGETSATARFTEREHGQGPSEFYDNLAVYRDELVKQPDGWKFKRRFYEYRYLDTSAFTGTMLPSEVPPGSQ